MNYVLIVLVAVLLVGGAPGALLAAESAFTGEVWTWDERQRLVTLRQLDGRLIHVKVPAATLRTLRLHDTMTIRGELASVEIERVQRPAAAMRPMPQGTPVRSELTGMVARVEREGVITITSPRGALRVWVEPPAERFREGLPVRVETAVRSVVMVPIATGGDVAPAPAVSPGPDPGDYAVVMGRVTAVDRDGRLTVESPRGPLTVWVADSAAYRVGDVVEVQTAVHPTG